MDLFNKNKIKLLKQENENLKKKIFDNSLLEKNRELEAKNVDLINTIKTQEKHLKGLYADDIYDLSELNYYKNYSEDLKRKIDTIKSKEKRMDDVVIIRDTFDYSDKELKSISLFAQIVFDIKCDYLINSLKYNTKNNLIDKINTLASRIESKCDFCQLEFNKKYIELKADEAYSALVYKIKLQQEKEQKAKEIERLKDQTKADKEIQQRLNKEERDLADLKYRYVKMLEKGQDTQSIQKQIDIMQSNVDKDVERLTKNKSGYVYVVGNRDMRKGLLKIGITRRNIEDRMAELGNMASHSFPMEVYGYVFVDDCYGLEAKLHNYFRDKRLNINNRHKEWFITNLKEVKRAFKEIGGVDIELLENPCKDYLKSLENFVEFYK